MHIGIADGGKAGAPAPAGGVRIAARRLAAGWCAAVFFALVPGMLRAEPVVHQPTGIAFPDEIAGFVRGRAVNHEEEKAGLGFSYGYHLRPGVNATVYVYSARQCPVPAGIENSAVTRMRDQTLAEIREFYGAAEDVSHEVVRYPGENGDAPVFLDVLKVRMDGAPLETMVWLWASRDHFIKIRLSGAAPLEEPDAARKFAAAVVRLAEPEPASSPPKKVPPRVSVQIAKLQNKNESEAWLLYGISLLQWAVRCTALESAPSGLLQSSFAAERYARAKQIDIWRKMGRGRNEPLPYLEELIEIEEAGYLDDYVWRHHRRPAWGAVPASIIARSDEFEQWMAKKFPGHKPQTNAGVMVRPE